MTFSKEVSDRLRSLDPKCMLSDPWIFLLLLPTSVQVQNEGLLWSLLLLGCQKVVQLSVMFALGQVCKEQLVAQKM